MERIKKTEKAGLPACRKAGFLHPECREYVNIFDIIEYSGKRIVLHPWLCYAFSMQEKKEGERMQNRMDLRSLLRLVGRSSPIWLLCMLLCAAGVYGVSAYCIPPSYTASATLYIYNSQEDTRELNAGNVDTSRKLVSTCSVVLQSDRTLEQVLRRTGGKRSLEELRGMLHMEAVDHTEILRISVSSGDPEEAATLCNTLLDCAPTELLRVLQGGSVKVIDTAAVPEHPDSPNAVVNAILGAVLGLAGSITAILTWNLLDGRVRTAEELEPCGAPVLAEIPIPFHLGEEATWCEGSNPNISSNPRLC